MRFSAIFTFLLLLSLCSCSGDIDMSSQVTGNQWTIMVYMDADNNLDVSAPLDVQEMLDVGSTANVTIILQYDSRSTPTRRYRIDKGNLVLLEDLGEQNMASADTLRDFIVYGVKNNPAPHYALILWDHGEGWQSGVDKRVSSILEDWNNTDIKGKAIPNYLIAKGIQDAAELDGAKLDILGVDACLMATIEAAYEFRDSASVLVSSQDVVQGLGWDYRDLLRRLTNNPAMSPRDLAIAMVDSYRQFAESSSYGYGDQTISALKLGNGMETLAMEVDALALRMKAALDNSATRDATLQKITEARATVQELHPPTYVDLADFSVLLEPSASLTPIQNALQAVTIAEYHGAKRPGVHGLNIVFYNLPDAITYSVYNFDYKNYDSTAGAGSRSGFINNYNWDEMMSAYFVGKYPDLVR